MDKFSMAMGITMAMGQGQVPILFVPSEANLPKSLLTFQNHPFYKAINLKMIP
jgi:hypothetical protein